MSNPLKGWALRSGPSLYTLVIWREALGTICTLLGIEPMELDARYRAYEAKRTKREFVTDRLF